MPDKTFLDTNIIVYAHDRASPERKAKSQRYCSSVFAVAAASFRLRS